MTQKGDRAFSMRLSQGLFGSFFLFSSLSAVENIPFVDQVDLPETEWEAYFTGPLLSPTGTVTPVGLFNIEPYLFMTVVNGMYDNHWQVQKIPNFYSVNPLIFFSMGLVERVDFSLFLPFSYNWSQNQSSFGMSDAEALLGFQLYEADDQTWAPWIQLSLNGFFPTGKYQRANPQKQTTDLHGTGRWGMGLNLIFYKLLHIFHEHFLSLNLSFAYTLFSHVNVEGFNAYGGGFNTRGRVRPGNNFVTSFSFEYSFTNHWAFAMDTVYNHTNRNGFSGITGFTQTGQLARTGDSSSELFSIAPAVEYNFNQYFGIISGIWFSVIGRNTNRFQSAVIAVNYLF